MEPPKTSLYSDFTPGERLSAIAEMLATAVIRYNMRRGQKDGEQNAKAKFKTEKVRGGMEDSPYWEGGGLPSYVKNDGTKLG